MLDKAKKFLFELDDYVAIISLVSIVMVTTLGVFMRYVVGSPLKWNEEVVIALFVWFTFFGASSVFKRNGHVSIDYFYDKMPINVQKVMDGIKYLVVLIVAIGVFIILGYQLSMNAWTKVTPILRIRYTFIDLAVPITGFLMMIHLIRSIYVSAKGGEKKVSEEE